MNVPSQSDIERERYQARLKWQRDQHAYIDDAYERGELIGGIQAFELATKSPITPKEDLKALTLEELQSRAKLLEDRLRSARTRTRSFLQDIGLPASFAAFASLDAAAFSGQTDTGTAARYPFGIGSTNAISARPATVFGQVKSAEEPIEHGKMNGKVDIDRFLLDAVMPVMNRGVTNQ